MSKATLNLRKAIWNETARRSALNAGLTEAAVELETDLLANIDNSKPTGRFYSLGSLTARRTRANANLNRRRGTSTRVVTGARVYQASSSGQPPARRTDRLYRGIKVRRVERGIRATVDAKYGKYLDNPEILNRPFFRSRVAKFRKERYVRIVKARILALT